MAQLRHRRKAFEQLGAQVVLVGLGNVDQTAAFKEGFGVPFDMIADPDKNLHDRFQLKRATMGSLFSVGMVVKGIRAMANGHGIGEPQGDVRQLPGVFVIAAGRILFSHYATGPADNPTPDQLLKTLRAETAN